MKTKKLLGKLREYFDDQSRARKEKRTSLKKLLKKMRIKEKELKHKLEHERDAEQAAKIEAKIALLHAQRKKGVALLKEDDF